MMVRASLKQPIFLVNSFSKIYIGGNLRKYYGRIKVDLSINPALDKTLEVN